MKIAIASQDKQTITPHAGRCQNFWIYDIDQTAVLGKSFLELPKEQSFHNSSPYATHPLDEVQVLIAGGMGRELVGRLARKEAEYPSCAPGSYHSGLHNSPKRLPLP
ncbi:nitrogen fixation protein [filamentous cyanobacterium CCP5]|nr:nitrogen fixation protein [filamentous cyanobacterium CCP5]